MKTIKSINDRLIDITMDLRFCSWRNDNVRLQAIQKRINKAKIEYDKHQQDYWNLLKGALRGWDDLNKKKLETEYQTLLHEREKKRKKIEIPANILEWFKTKYVKGVSFGKSDDSLVIVWISMNKRFGIVTNRGGKAWAGRSSNYKYAPARHWGIEILGKSYLNGNVLTEKVEGILTKEVKAKLIDRMVNNF